MWHDALVGVPELELVRLGYEMFEARGLDGIVERLDPDIEWHEPEDLPDSPVMHGRDEARRHLEALLRNWERFSIELEALSEPAEGQVLAEVRVVARGRASGAEVDTRHEHLWTLRAGRATRVQIYDRERHDRAARPSSTAP